MFTRVLKPGYLGGYAGYENKAANEATKTTNDRSEGKDNRDFAFRDWTVKLTMKKSFLILSIATIISCTSEKEPAAQAVITPSAIPAASELKTATKTKELTEKEKCLEKAKTSKFSFADTLMCGDGGF